MSLTFNMVDEIFKEYGLVSSCPNGIRTEYAFPVRKSLAKKKNVATIVRPLVNGGVGGYIYVGFLEDYKLKYKVPLSYKYIKNARNQVKFNDMSEQELRALLERVIKHYI